MEQKQIRVRITARSVMAGGLVFSSGDVLKSTPDTYELLQHFVNCGDAELLESNFENKKADPVTEVKKPRSISQSLPPEKAPPVKTRKPRTRKPRP